MNTPTTIDWFRLLWDLIQRGHTLQAVADRTGIGRTTLRGYLDGSQPPHWRGELLVALWCQTCDKSREDTPMIEMVIAPRVVQNRTAPRVDREAARGLEEAWK